MQIYRVVITDDHQLFRRGLRHTLDQISDVKVVAEANSGSEFIDYLKENPVDLVFMDIKMPDMDGITTTTKALEIQPNLKVVALTMFDEVDYYSSMVEAGAEAFLLKDISPSELEMAIKRVMQDDNYLSDGILNSVADKSAEEKPKEPVAKLTKRELEILGYLCKGYSNQEIADELFISLRTVQGHRANLISKTKSKNSIDLVIYAVKNRIIQV